MDSFSELVAKYNLTSNPTYLDKKYKITPKIDQLLEETYYPAIQGKQSAIKKLQNYIRDYPHIPHFKNYLEKAYEQSGNEEKARQVNERARREHPDYLYAKLNYANHLIRDGEPERVPEILGEELDLKALYPERAEFHYKEVLGFFKTCLQYYLAVDEQDNANKCLELMETIDPDDPVTEEALSYWFRNNMENASRRLQEEQERRRSVEARSYDKSVQTSEPPTFTHSEIRMLYEQDMQIDHDLISDILELPRESLVSDLEAIVEDSIRRYEYFREINDQEGYWDAGRFSFPMHALFLLAELESEQSLELVLRLLRQGEDLLDFWFGDVLQEHFWVFLYQMGQHRLSDLKAFVQEPDNFTYARITVPQTVTELALHQPERRQEALDWYRDLFRYFLENLEDDRVIDTDLISLMVWNCVDFNAHELGDVISDLYRNDLVEPNMAGQEEEVMQDLRDPKHQKNPRPVHGIYQHYEEFVDSWYRDDTEEVDWDATKDSEFDSNGGSLFSSLLQNNPAMQPFEAEEEPGRNDPCPCGRGKKYKHCCMRK